MATVTATKTSPKRRRRTNGARVAPGWVAGRLAIAVAALLAGAAVVLAGRVSALSALDDARALVQQGRPPTDPAVRNLVRYALSRDLTQPAALELAALADERRGDRPTVARLYALSDRISRRSLATRIWLIQDAVARGDVKATLANMDLALRTSSAAPGFVFPALARGLDDPALVRPIAAMVDRRSDWREAFLIYAADNAEPSSAAALFLALRDRRVILTNELDRKLIIRLADAGQFQLAPRVDAAFDPRTRGSQLVLDGNFGNPAARYPFGWGLTDKSELGASRETENDRPILAYRANAAEGGQVAAQLLTLSPGSYSLQTRVGRSDETEIPPLWTLSCPGEGKLIAMLALPSGQEARSSVRFTVPGNCSAQWLVLTVRPALAPQSGSIENVTIAAR